jgi:hypothetical protein
MVSAGLELRTSGPLFDGRAPAEVRKIRAEIIRLHVREGKRQIKAELSRGRGVDTGEYKRGIKGRSRRGRFGKVWALDARISAWLEGVSSLNRKSRFKGYGVWTAANEDVVRRSDSITNEAGDRLAKKLGGR